MLSTPCDRLYEKRWNTKDKGPPPKFRLQEKIVIHAFFRCDALDKSFGGKEIKLRATRRRFCGKKVAEKLS